MNPHDFLTLAQSLEAEQEEAAWRSAASRAYYAAFHVAHAFLSGLRFQVPGSDRAHGYLWLRLQNCGDSLVAAVGRELHSARRRRNDADYVLSRSFSQSHASQLVRIAEGIIQELEAAAADPVRAAAIQAEVIRYERDVLQDVTFIP